MNPLDGVESEISACRGKRGREKVPGSEVRDYPDLPLFLAIDPSPGTSGYHICP